MPLPSDFLDRYGPWAVITGASSGIGAESAKQLAAAGLSLVLVARRKEHLEAAARTLEEHYPIQVKTIVADLTTDEGITAVVNGTTDIDVGLLFCNAGTASQGSFFRQPVDVYDQMIALNVTAPMRITHPFGLRLGKKGKGGIIFTSSMAAAGIPSFAVYSASKSFVSTFSKILRVEMSKVGVDVLCLEPGVVRTEMFEQAQAAGADMSKAGFYPQSVGQCVSEALQALYDGKTAVTPGLMNRISAAISSLIPHDLLMKILDYLLDNAMDSEARKFPINA